MHESDLPQESDRWQQLAKELGLEPEPAGSRPAQPETRPARHEPEADDALQEARPGRELRSPEPQQPREPAPSAEEGEFPAADAGHPSDEDSGRRGGRKV